MSIISTYQLTKTYGNQAALSNFTLQISEGEIFGLLGPANSGKTTFLRILAGLVTPTEGEFSILGLSPKTDLRRILSVTGVVTETAKFYPDMTVDENLRFYAGLHEVGTDDAIDRISFLLHNLNIWEYRDIAAKHLPTNAMQRANIARALVHSPKVLLLDEPTMMMDRETTESVQYIIDYIAQQEGVTSLICTRYPEHAESICTQFGIINQAELMIKGDFEKLRVASGLRYQAELHITPDSLLPVGFRHEAGVWRKKIQKEEDMPAIIADAISHGCKIYEAKILRPSLTEICDSFISGQYLENDLPQNQFEELQDYNEWQDIDFDADLEENEENRQESLPIIEPEGADTIE